MFKFFAIILIIINTSSANLNNLIILVDNEVFNIGRLKKNEVKRVEIHNKDSIRVLFTLGHEREDWLGTSLISVRDTIKISDSTEIFDVEFFEPKE